MTNKYIPYIYEYYYSNMTLEDFCKLKNLTYWGFYEFIIHREKHGVDLDMKARTKRLKEQANPILSPIVPNIEDVCFKEIVEGILQVLKNFGIRYD